MTKQEEVILLRDQILEITESIDPEWMEIFNILVHKMNRVNELETEIYRTKEFTKMILLK